MTAEWIGLGGTGCTADPSFSSCTSGCVHGGCGGCRDDGLDWHRSRRKSFTHGSMD